MNAKNICNLFIAVALLISAIACIVVIGVIAILLYVNVMFILTDIIMYIVGYAKAYGLLYTSVPVPPKYIVRPIANITHIEL